MKNSTALFALALWTITLIAPTFAQESRGRNASGRSTSLRAPRPGQHLATPSAVRPASHAGEMVVDGGEYVGGDIIDGGYIESSPVGFGCDSCGNHGCDSCSLSGGSCGSCSSPRGFCVCFPSHGWVHAEYLLWFQQGMRLPPLVTTSPAGTPRASAGLLGLGSTSVLYGNDDIFTDGQSGFRVRFGWWLASFAGWGIEGEYTGLGEQTESFFQQSNGSPILARPFFNALTGLDDSELVAFPDVIRGSIAVDATNSFEGAAFRLRRQLCGTNGCDFSQLCCETVPTSSRLDLTLGYRFWQLDESLRMTEDLTSLTTNSPGSFDIVDHFDTRNQFNGAEVGFLWQARRGWWSLDALMRVAIGNTHQTVTIAGNSVITDNTTVTSYDTGFLAQRTNIGTYDRDTFTIIPELGVTAGYQLTKRLRATMGYSLIYWGNVVRPGDQVDLDVNPNLLAPENDPFSGPLRPQFQFVGTDYWVQGLSFGGEFRW